MADGLINGVMVYGYTKTEDVIIDMPEGPKLLGTEVTMSNGMGVFLYADDKEVIEENLSRGSKICFDDRKISLNAHNLVRGQIKGVPGKKDHINLWDCYNTTVNVENRSKKDSPDNVTTVDNDCVRVIYTDRKTKPNTNAVTANDGDIINGKTVESERGDGFFYGLY